MAWTIYELRFRLQSPLHIGQMKLGNVHHTRFYVPAQVMWAALTARLTRKVQCGEWNPQDANRLRDYTVMGDRVQRDIAFSYFYPLDNGNNFLYPHFMAEGLHFGAIEMTWQTFSWRYLGSYASTALNYCRWAAEDGSLHEIEFLAPHTRPDVDLQSYPVYLAGYALVSQGSSLPWKENLMFIQVGAERRYGWGRLHLESAVEVEQKEREKCFFGLFSSDVSGDRPRVHVSPGEILLAHTKVSGLEASGQLEPLVQRVWHPDRGPGHSIKFTEVCHVPGSTLKGEQKRCFNWTTNHIWEVRM